MQYKNYVFDLYGTLVDVSTDEKKLSLWKTMADLYGCYGAIYEPKALRKRFFQMDQEEREKMSLVKGTPWPEIQLEKVFLRLLKEAPAGTLRLPEQEDVWAELMANTFRVVSRKYLRLFPETLHVLQTLKEQDCRIYLLSNAQAIFTRPEIHLMGIEEYFDAMYLSSDFDLKKPEPAYLRLLMEKEGLKPSETVMIGNEMESDVKIADACGIDAIFVNLLHEAPEAIQAKRERYGIRQKFAVVEDIGEVVNY